MVDVAKVTRAPSTAMAIANWLQKSWEEPDVPACDQMKLYKLVYYDPSLVSSQLRIASL